MHTYLSTCLYVYLSIHMSMHMSMHMSIHTPVNMSEHMSAHIYTMSTQMTLHVSISHMPICVYTMSIHISIHVCAYISMPQATSHGAIEPFLDTSRSLNDILASTHVCTHVRTHASRHAGTTRFHKRSSTTLRGSTRFRASLRYINQRLRLTCER